MLLIPMPGRRCCVDAMAMVRDWGWPKRVLNCACEMVQVLSRWSVCQLAVSWIAMESAGVCAFVAMERRRMVMVMEMRAWRRCMVMGCLCEKVPPLGAGLWWRCQADSNCCERFCRPVPNHSDMAPCVLRVQRYGLSGRFPNLSVPFCNMLVAGGCFKRFEPRVGLEPTTFSLRMKCSTN